MASIRKQDFVDAAALGVMASLMSMKLEPGVTLPHVAKVAYNAAAALWEERERRAQEENTSSVKMLGEIPP